MNKISLLDTAVLVGGKIFFYFSRLVLPMLFVSPLKVVCSCVFLNSISHTQFVLFTITEAIASFYLTLVFAISHTVEAVCVRCCVSLTCRLSVWFLIRTTKSAQVGQRCKSFRQWTTALNLG